MKNNHIDGSNENVKTFVKRLHTQITNSTLPQQPGYLNFDAYLGLLDYTELRDARKDSLNAKRQARTAIYVAVGLGIVQIVVAIWQIRAC